MEFHLLNMLLQAKAQKPAQNIYEFTLLHYLESQGWNLSEWEEFPAGDGRPGNELAGDFTAFWTWPNPKFNLDYGLWHYYLSWDYFFTWEEVILLQEPLMLIITVTSCHLLTFSPGDCLYFRKSSTYRWNFTDDRGASSSTILPAFFHTTGKSAILTLLAQLEARKIRDLIREVEIKIFQ